VSSSRERPPRTRRGCREPPKGFVGDERPGREDVVRSHWFGEQVDRYSEIGLKIKPGGLKNQGNRDVLFQTFQSFSRLCQKLTL